MAASSSSGERKISKGPQVFINFLGKEMYKCFIAHLEVALKEAKINVFIYKHERVGTRLQNLFVRIEQSRVALVILSKDYTTSVRCLDELVKIKECIDKGSLTGIPIFYKLETSVVSNLEGYFGDNFRTLKRENQYDLVKTQKWEEALISISQTMGIHLSENSDQPDREFIESIVRKVKSLLDDILSGEKADQKRHKVNSQCSIHMMKEDLDSLQTAMGELEDRQHDLLVRVSIEEDKGLQGLAQVKGWLSRVETVGSQVKDLLEARSTETERLCLFGDCSDDHGKEVLKRLKEVKELLSKGIFDVVAQNISAPKAEEMHIQTTVGLDTKVEMAWNSLMNDERRILGLYGMGGVGKTTLLNRINNKFVEVENEFDVVIWVVVSKDFQNEDIQDQILGRLRVDNEWKQETEKGKSSLIKNNLKRKKFVLLLDDIWNEVDLKKIGVPAPTRENGSKIVFTTRSKEVCNYMIADEQIKVDCLSPVKAWELFRITVGEIPLKRHQDIPTLARKVVEKCCGLPLALNVIGKAMACKEDVREWRHAIDVLNSTGHEFPGMEERILPILKFSYDSLQDGVKLCFLYCSLFPEDYEIKKEELIEYWICEGFINSNRYEDGGTNQGYDIIGLLVRAHLLIDCELKTKVKMHDVIREMALWIEYGFGNQQETICVKSGAHIRLIPKQINWEILRRMSFMRTQIEEISCSPNCPNLSTLLLRDNFKLADVSVGFFRFMPQLVVLDLSRNSSLWGVPEEISNFGSLKYLNLSFTEIKSLPVGLHNLRKLIYLSVEFTKVLESLVGIATTLPNLQVLKLYMSDVFVDDILMEELQRLEHLKVLTANIKDAMILGRIQGVDRLARCIRGLCLRFMSAPLVILNTVALRGLQRLGILDCKISEIKIDWKSEERRELSPVEILPSTSSPGFKDLSDIYILNLEGPRDLSWLLFAQNLRKLTVDWSSTIEKIINKEKGMSITKLHPDIVVPFENLEDLMLYGLDGLTEICSNYPNLPNCKSLFVLRCPKLPEDIANQGWIHLKQEGGTCPG